MSEESIAIPTLTRPLDAIATVPGSKSLTNRALVIAALADGESELVGGLTSEDVEMCTSCLRALGFTIETDIHETPLRVIGRNGLVPAEEATGFVGLSGTTARFVPAIAALGGGVYTFDGVPRMRERPMQDLLGALTDLGVHITFADQTGKLPFTIHANGLNGGHIRIAANETSQQLSGLLMAAPYAQTDIVIEATTAIVSRPYVDMTIRVMADFGVKVDEPTSGVFHVAAGQRYRAQRYIIEPDASNASYFFAMAAVSGGRVVVPNLLADSCQGDIAFLDVLKAMGCEVRFSDEGVEVTGPRQLQGGDFDLHHMSDTVMTLAAIAPFAATPVTIRNVANIRLKETDRLAAVATELRRIGIVVEERDDGLTIVPGTPRGAAIETYNDHRMAMAFAVTGLLTPGIIITNPRCVAKTFPDFFERMQAVTQGGA